MADFFYSQEADLLDRFQNITWIVSYLAEVKSYRGCPVSEISSLSLERHDIVVVATTEKHHSAICSQLEKQGICRCYLLTIEYMASRIAEMQDRYYKNGILAVNYCKIPNMGDLLNELLIKKYYGCSVQENDYYCARMAGIGSSLQGLFSEDESLLKLGKCIDKKYPLAIWGTGFGMDLSDRQLRRPIRDRLEICALRGNLSKNKLENALGKEIHCAIGDPGLLAKELVDEKKIEKKYAVGIIPHYREIGLSIVDEMRKWYRFSTIINLREDPMEVILRIAECEVIISSSLHGAVVADSFGIPNILVKISNIPIGDGFKYRDYYSGYGLSCLRMEIKRGNPPVREEYIKDNYAISQNEVAEKRKSLKDVMPKFL